MGCAEGRSPSPGVWGVPQIQFLPPSWLGRGLGGWSRGFFSTLLGKPRELLAGSNPAGKPSATQLVLGQRTRDKAANALWRRILAS
jgi:hypothetical protein